jgi:uncharacterized protein Yka (UPF0111/DUF47 family)
MADIESKIAEIWCENCACNKHCDDGGWAIYCRERLARMIALIAADRAGQCKLCEQLDKGLDEVMVDAVKRLKKQNKGLVEALKEIAMGNGAYNRDPFKHLENCYDHMKEVADSALKEMGK